MDNIKHNFIESSKNNKYKIPSETHVWFTDGSCAGNGKENPVGGYASICVNGKNTGMFIIGKMDNDIAKATNIRAEGLAIAKTLEFMLSNISEKGLDDILIYSDSKFWINMIYKYMPNWPENKFHTQSNTDLTLDISKLWKEIKSSVKSIDIVHVYAHNKDSGKTSSDAFKKFCYTFNNIADELAVYARSLDSYKAIKKNLIQ